MLPPVFFTEELADGLFDIGDEIDACNGFVFRAFESEQVFGGDIAGFRVVIGEFFGFGISAVVNDENLLRFDGRAQCGLVLGGGVACEQNKGDEGDERFHE